MKLITDINAANALRQQYRGASFQAHPFSKSLWRLGVELRHPKKPEVLYVVGIGFKHITSGFRHRNAHWEIIQPLPGYPATAQKNLISRNAR
ncbi:hypothetical protein AB6805_13955 [Chitinophaga sp. RCC_12]|uniref:hypothetical protein n=1 Tax=Chitinophaga sp. RCC_12 TaxID=3239226 RepID=UPI0035232463